MRAIYTQFSGLAGLLAFLSQLWDYAPIERTIFLGFATGLVVYVMLLLGDATIHRILAHTPATLAEEGAGSGGGKHGGQANAGAKKAGAPEAKTAAA